jgi:hypothetical protein
MPTTSPIISCPEKMSFFLGQETHSLRRAILKIACPVCLPQRLEDDRIAGLSIQLQ